MASKDCCICFETFNKSRRKCVRCPYCSIEDVGFCRTCVETYLTQDDAQVARCPNPSCRSGWSDDFLSENMTAKFLTGPYKLHREKVLLDLERARLPETQEDAQRYRRARQQVQTEFEPAIMALQADISALPEIAEEVKAVDAYQAVAKDDPKCQNAVTKAAFDVYIQKNSKVLDASRPIQAKIRAIRSSEAFQEAVQLMQSFGAGAAGANTNASAGASASNKRHWTFVMKCGACEGFVGMNWACGLCDVKYCKECREPTDSSHVCDEDKRQTVAALVKEAKPCPKCAAMISKIDGCDQMWCTQCRTAFSWRTGAIETMHVHNPHYFEWMRRNGGAAPQRAIAECVEPMEVLDAIFRAHYNNKQVSDWVRTLRHYYYDLRMVENQMRIKQDDEWRRVLRVKRLVGDIDDAKWKLTLQRGEKAANKNQRHAQIVQTFIHAGVDTLRGILDGSATPESAHDQMLQLMHYCNSQLDIIRTRFKNQVDSILLLESSTIRLPPVLLGGRVAQAVE